MAERGPEHRNFHDDFEIRLVDGFVLSSKDDGPKRVVVIRNHDNPRGLVAAERPLIAGDDAVSLLRRVMLTHDPETDTGPLIRVEIHVESAFAPYVTNFDLPTDFTDTTKYQPPFIRYLPEERIGPERVHIEPQSGDNLFRTNFELSVKALHAVLDELHLPPIG